MELEDISLSISGGGIKIMVRKLVHFIVIRFNTKQYGDSQVLCLDQQRNFFCAGTRGNLAKQQLKSGLYIPAAMISGDRERRIV